MRLEKMFYAWERKLEMQKFWTESVPRLEWLRKSQRLVWLQFGEPERQAYSSYRKDFSCTQTAIGSHLQSFT